MFGAFSSKEESNDQQLCSEMVNNRTVMICCWKRVNDLHGGLNDDD